MPNSIEKQNQKEQRREQLEDTRDDYQSDLSRVQSDWIQTHYIIEHAENLAQMSKDLKEIEDQTLEALQISVLKSQAAAHLLARLNRVMMATFPEHHTKDLQVIREGLRMIAGDPTLVALEYQQAPNVNDRRFYSQTPVICPVCGGDEVDQDEPEFPCKNCGGLGRVEE